MVTPIRSLNVYEPEESLLPSIYIQMLDIRPADTPGEYHVWAVTMLQRHLRVTRNSLAYVDAERRLRHLLDGIRAHFDRCA